MKESFYFSHDFNAHDDPKIKRMMRKHGAAGYGAYWYIVELLAAETGRWFLPKEDYEGIAFELRLQCDCIKSIVEDFELFKFDDENFWNKRLDSHFDLMAQKSATAKKNAEKRWAKERKVSQKNATALQPQCEPNAIKDNKRKIIKEKKRKETYMAETHFEKFWEKYPNKKKKKKAMENFMKLEQSLFGEIMAGLELCKKSRQWVKDGGQFIPHPSTWLNGEEWSNEEVEAVEHCKHCDGPCKIEDPETFCHDYNGRIIYKNI